MPDQQSGLALEFGIESGQRVVQRSEVLSSTCQIPFKNEFALTNEISNLYILVRNNFQETLTTISTTTNYESQDIKTLTFFCDLY